MSRPLTIRRRRLAAGAVAAVVAGVVALAVGGASSGDVPAGADRASGPEEQAELLAGIPGAVSRGTRTIEVDLSQPGVAEALSAMGDELSGYTVVVSGLEIATSEERRRDAAAVEAQLVRQPGRMAEQLCAPVPTGPRATDGSTVARLNCDPVTGVSRTQSFAGNAHDTLRMAVSAVLANYVRVDERDIVVREPRPGVFEIDVTKRVGTRLSGLDFAESSQLLEDVLFTLYSNGNVESASMSVEGDCLAFAQAVGGDVCGTFRPNDLPDPDLADLSGDAS